MKKPLSDAQVLWLWVLAFGLKLAGATADASWHFKYLRETLAIPHVINIVGNLLGFGLLLYQLIRHHRLDQKGFWITWAGSLTFMVAAPIDDWYHRAFGLDLTAWSPPHYLLYFGTFLMLLGCLRMAVGARGRLSPAAFLWIAGLLAFFLMEDVAFPMVQQEYGAVTLFLIELGQWRPAADLLALVKDPYYQAYGMLPTWLYPVYLTGSYLFTMSLARHLTGLRWGATLTTGLYLTFRLLARLILGGLLDLPVSYIPLFILVVAMAVDLLAREARWWIRLPLTTVVGTGLVWLSGWLSPKVVAYTPLWPLNAWPLALGAAVVGLLLAGMLSRWLAVRGESKQPVASAA
jgi:hypothetical protein